MEIVTIACPPGFTDSNVDQETAPVWVDSKGVRYLVASGLLEGYITSDPVEVRTDRVNVVVGPEALNALTMMGLRQVEEEI